MTIEELYDVLSKKPYDVTVRTPDDILKYINILVRIGSKYDEENENLIMENQQLRFQLKGEN